MVLNNLDQSCCSWHVLTSFRHTIYFQVWLGWKMHQTWKANSPFPLHSAWDVNPDCSKVTPSTQILPSLVGTHNNTAQSSPPSPFPILSLHSFRLFSCLSGALTGSSSFTPLISPDLTSPSSHHCLLFHRPRLGIVFVIKLVKLLWGVVLFCLLLLILLVWTPSLIDDSCMFAPSIWTTILSWL